MGYLSELAKEIGASSYVSKSGPSPEQEKLIKSTKLSNTVKYANNLKKENKALIRIMTNEFINSLNTDLSDLIDNKLVYKIQRKSFATNDEYISIEISCEYKHIASILIDKYKNNKVFEDVSLVVTNSHGKHGIRIKFKWIDLP